MSLKPKKFKARVVGKPKKIRGRHLVLGSSVDSMNNSRDVNRAFSLDAMPIAGPSGVRAAYPASHKSRPPTRTQTPSTLIETIPEPPTVSEDTEQRPPTAKRDTQWKKWTEVILPELIPLYLHLQRTSQGFARPQEPLIGSCNCGGVQARHIDVLCLHFGGTLLHLPCKHS